MKNKLYIFTFALLIPFMVFGQSTWQFVGPKKNTNGLYESGRLDVIVFDPGYNGGTNQIIYAGSFGGGLWRTTDDGATWNNISTSTLKLSGVSGIAIDPVTKDLYVSDFTFHSAPLYEQRSSGVHKLSGTNGTWTTTGAFPVPAGKTLVIRSLKMHPDNSQILLACTSVGIYRTTDAGGTWTLVDNSAEFKNIVFTPKTGGGYNVYASGDQKKFVISTNDGATFTNVTWSNSTTLSYDNVYFELNYGGLAADGSQIIYLLGVASKATNFTIQYPGHPFNSNTSVGKGYVVYKFLRSTAGVNTLNYVFGYTDSDINTTRITVCGTKDFVYTGGDRLWKYNFSAPTPGVYDPIGSASGAIDDAFVAPGNSPDYYYPNDYEYTNMIHADLHDIRIFDNGTIRRVFVATDGGLSVNNYTITPTPGLYSNTWGYKNNGIHNAQVHGFCSSETDPDLYATGEHDTKGFVFHASDMSTCKTWGVEPTEVWIDRFNADLMLMNTYQGNAELGSVLDATTNFTMSIDYSWFYAPAAGSVFAADLSQPRTHIRGIARRFFQDTKRPGKIYSFERGIFQYDPVNRVFATKYETGKDYSSTDPYVRDDSWFSTAAAMAISPTDENFTYFVTDADSTSEVDAGGVKRHVMAHIYKYNRFLNGTDVDINDSWEDHNDNKWEKITPNLNTLFGLGWAVDDPKLYQYTFKDIEVSDWDPNTIFVAIKSGLPEFNNYKVIRKKNGVWTNYSNGIPADEYITFMIYERGSADAIYLGTNRNVYFRNMYSTQWFTYDTDLPHIYMSQLDINYKENTVRVGTFGRGIWKKSLWCPELPTKPVLNCFNCSSPTDFFWEGENVIVTNSRLNNYKAVMRATDYIDVVPGSAYSDFDATVTSGVYYDLFIHGCNGAGNSFKVASIGDTPFRFNEEEAEQEELKELGEINVFPNPSNGSFTLWVGSEEEKDVFIYDLLGKVVFQKMNTEEKKININLSTMPKGIYIVKVINDERSKVKKITIE